MALPLNDAGMWSGLLLGAAFGFVLERAGFGSPGKLTGQFRLNDWSVLKVMFTAIVVAAAGIWALRAGGLLAEEGLFVPPSLLVASALGGALVGAGFAIGGYCPGTSVVGLSSGRVDALVFVVGLLIGTFVFAGFYGPTMTALLASGEMESGDTFAEAWGWSDPLLIGLMGVAVAAIFVLARRFEGRGAGPVTAEQAVQGSGAEPRR